MIPRPRRLFSTSPESARPKALQASPLVRTQVSNWPKRDQPWRRLLAAGPSSLSDSELLSILIGRGMRQGDEIITSVDIARELLRRCENLYGIAVRPTIEQTEVPGIGDQTAARIAAAVELGRRIESQRQGERVQVCSPEDVAAVYGPLMRDLNNEVFKVVFLNTANIIIGDDDVSVGGLSSAVVECRSIFRSAINRNAAAIICIHNHPSSNPEPSREDVRITRQISEAGKLMGVPLHDHLIIAGSAFTSLAQRGVLDN